MWKLPEFVSEEDITDKPMVLLLVLSAVLQTSIIYSPGESGARLRNKDVMTLLRHGLPESLVLKAINAIENDFDLSNSGLRDLERTGVSDQLINAMQSANLEKSRRQ
jgi:hypothetical protein